MASSLIKLETLNNIAPGATLTRHWNNATPSKAVWYIQAIPAESSLQGAGTASFAVEVTRIWRNMNITKEVHGEFPRTTTEHEIYYTIKNVGAKEIDVDVYASIIS